MMPTRRATLLPIAFAVIGLFLCTQAGAGERQDFKLGELEAFVIPPDSPASVKGKKPWVWYAPTLGKNLPGKAEQWMLDRLHARGIALAGVDVGESMGNPEGRAGFQKLYEHMVAQGYGDKPVLLARSRGGLMLYNWAVEHPKSVGGVAGIYPVCNLASWPGLKKAAPAYGMTPEELEAELPQHNPIDRIAPLAKLKVPIYHIHGTNDTVVPHDKNTRLLVERYKTLGGPAELEIIEGGGHDMKPHWFESQALTQFMIDRALADHDSE